MYPNRVFSDLREELDLLFPESLSVEIVIHMQSAHERLKAYRERPESEAFEDGIAADANRLSTEILRTALVSLDIQQPSIIHNGPQYHRADQTKARVLSSFGVIEYMRTRYRRRGVPSVFPCDVRAGLLEGFWTPRAGRIALHLLCSLTPRECVKAFRQQGGMCPSVSSLVRLYDAAGRLWEDIEDEALARIRSEEDVPPDAAVVTLQIDGVMVPLGQERIQKRQEDSALKGVEWKEATCAAVTLSNVEGEILRTVRHGRMPEPKKATIKRWVKDEVAALLARQPNLKLVAVADGAREYWRFFDDAFPQAEQVLDFYHAAENLMEAINHAYGKDSDEAKSRFAALRSTLFTEPDGVDRVIASLEHMRRNHSPLVSGTIGYFRHNRHRMNYADCKSRHLMIGSGLVESTNKVLVTQRMKNSGMIWGHNGGQSILSFRALNMSDRFDAAWKVLLKHWQNQGEPISA